VTGRSVRAGVIGWPVAHSLSPLMMEAWLEAAGMRGSYERIPAPPEGLKACIARLSEDGYSGVNITLPHKEAALTLADEASAAAKTVGAANILVFGGGKMIADNSDITGVQAALDEAGWQGGERAAVLIGAGGAARAALYVLRQAGVPVRIVNRSPDRARTLAAALGCKADIFTLEEADRALEDASLVINATSLGLAGQPPLTLSLSGVASNAAVFDMVYTPLETPLLAAARSAGLRAVDGLSMLIGQAPPAFEAFFGTPPPDSVAVRDLLEAALEARR